MTQVVAVITAAGSGERLGAGVPKAFVDLAGRTVVERSVEGLIASGAVDRIVVAVPADHVEKTAALLGGRAVVVAGGAERSDSVRCALEVAGDADFILVHDAARPLTPADQIRRVVAALQAGQRAVIPVLPLVDTVKAVDANGVVLGTPERAGLRAVQTPQGFQSALLRSAYQRAGDGGATDDAALVENLGTPVHTVAGDPLAFKITTALDLRLAQSLMQS